MLGVDHQHGTGRNHEPGADPGIHGSKPGSPAHGSIRRLGHVLSHQPFPRFTLYVVLLVDQSPPHPAVDFLPIPALKSNLHAEAINKFYRDYFNPYLNFHRPCGVPEVVTGAKGKHGRTYR